MRPNDMEESELAPLGLPSWERAMQAVEAIRRRLLRATEALETAGVPYAVTAGFGVAARVERVDQEAVRNNRDIVLLMRRDDALAAATALKAAGFVLHEAAAGELYLDGTSPKPRGAVRVVFAREKADPRDLLPAPDVTEASRMGRFRVLDLQPLVQMALTAFRLDDRVDLYDLMGVGLIDRSWLGRFPPELSARLQELLDKPDG
jgi:hypothetical protein